MEATPKNQLLLHMNAGEGNNSYARNSKIQENVMLRMVPAIEESISEFCDTFIEECFKFADLGCSSGPNATLFAYKTTEIVEAVSCSHNRKTPMFQVFFNDLPENDFNMLFKSLPEFFTRLHKRKGSQFVPCFVAAVPGSFYGRLFPNKSIHFFHSSSSLHWLSQVPKGLLGEDGTVNKGHIVPTITSPPLVHKAYADQFQEDLISFLTARAEESVPGGVMVLSLVGRTEADDHRHTFVVLSMALNQLVSENLIEKSKVDLFNLPAYYPTAKEVKQAIHTEGSFSLRKLEVFNTRCDEIVSERNDATITPITACIRAVAEPILRNHFGDTIMDEVFIRYDKISRQLMENKRLVITNLVMSMKKLDSRQ